jgi:hypothetical protein
MDHTYQIAKVQQEKEALLSSLAAINTYKRQLCIFSPSLDTSPPVITATSGLDGSDNAEDSDDFDPTPPGTPVLYVIYYQL